MNYNELFQNGSLKFIAEFVGQIVYQGFGAERTERNQFIVLLVSVLITVWLLYKLVWLVWKCLTRLINWLWG